MNRFRFLVIVAMVVPLQVHCERRRFSSQSLSDEIHVVTPTSVEESALFGSCTAEDCILGGNGIHVHDSQAPFDPPVLVHDSSDFDDRDCVKSDMTSTSTTSTSFGPLPAFKPR
jgi:hypothetical protein